MQLSKSIIIALTLVFIFKNGYSQTNFIPGKHPTWIMQGNIYEVNVRQYTPEGTFKAFEKHLQRIKNMGAQTLWFMPIYPISQKDRKGTLGSYYAISNYEAVNPEFGTLSDWKELVNKAHAMGFKVIIDWVANHTGADHYWLQIHPDFYVRDSAGDFVSPFDWTDVRKLNYSNTELVDSMIADMKFWVTQTNVDGFRCDDASDVPDAFWKKCIAELHKQKNVFMLAEGEKPSLNKDGFDATYAWSVFNVMKKIVTGEQNVTSLDSAVNSFDTAYPASALHMYFTSNHDENTWSKADYGTMPGKTHAPFAILTQTIKLNVPLIYGGQEEPVLRPIRFFDKDTIVFAKYRRAPFYKKLLLLRKYDPALASDAPFKRIKTNDDKNVYAYVRYINKKFVFVLLNLSDKKQAIKVNGFSVAGINSINAFDVIKGVARKNIFDSSFDLAPWGYEVLIDDDAVIEKELGLIK